MRTTGAARGFKTRPKPEKPDCRACGVCCVSPYAQDMYCDVNEKDIKRMPVSARKRVQHLTTFENLTSVIRHGRSGYEALETKTIKVKAGSLKDIEATVCTFLRGSVMHRVSCSIYSCRPEICRTAMMPGDRICLASRADLVEQLKG